MSADKTKKDSPSDSRGRDIAAEIANTLEWLVIAFVLAFLFRAFVMEAFRIPTGSMADTLMGDHFRLRCPQCGYRYDHGCDGLHAKQRRNPFDMILPRTHCPSCGYEPPTTQVVSKSNGDRILVLKCIYQFVEPKRWDVVVFKNPLEPRINYIKRLIGRPGETVEIIDGDIYIDGKISRKPPKVQNELWMPIYDNDYRPARPQEPFFNGRPWQRPLKNTPRSRWQIDRARPAEFVLDSDAEQINTLKYDSEQGNDFKASYAYNDITESFYRPNCSDLMVRFYAQRSKAEGQIGVALRKYESLYRGWVDFSGQMVISRMFNGAEDILNRREIEIPPEEKTVLLSFANVDHNLVLQFGAEKLTCDLGPLPTDAGARKTDIAPQAEIFGSGRLRLSHIAIFRDIHYTSKQLPGSGRGGRATEGRSLTLADDEFFVLGDNSPNSQDGRWWSRDGIGNNGRFFRRGIVPRDYLVGKALFVYWPGGYEFPWPRGLKTFLARNSGRNKLLWTMNVLVRLHWIPNISRMRFIYGGSGRNYKDTSVGD